MKRKGRNFVSAWAMDYRGENRYSREAGARLSRNTRTRSRKLGVALPDWKEVSLCLKYTPGSPGTSGICNNKDRSYRPLPFAYMWRVRGWNAVMDVESSISRTHTHSLANSPYACTAYLCVCTLDEGTIVIKFRFLCVFCGLDIMARQ